MKHTLKTTLLLLLAVTLLFAATACKKTETPQSTASASDNPTAALSPLWQTATYQEDQMFGDGNTTVQVEVQAEDKAVTFTVKTDKDNLGAALLEHGLIAGDEGEYGLYVKFVNGIEADYDKGGHYWSLCKDGGAVMTGVDSTPIKDGDHYELVYAK